MMVNIEISPSSLSDVSDTNSEGRLGGNIGRTIKRIQCEINNGS